MLALNHSFNLFSSVFTSVYSLPTSGDEYVIVVSFTKLNILREVELFMSFTYIKNSIGPRIEPWGTPQKRDFLLILSCIILYTVLYY